jgi:hypothetical protein
MLLAIVLFAVVFVFECLFIYCPCNKNQNFVSASEKDIFPEQVFQLLDEQNNFPQWLEEAIENMPPSTYQEEIIYDPWEDKDLGHQFTETESYFKSVKIPQFQNCLPPAKFFDISALNYLQLKKVASTFKKKGLTNKKTSGKGVTKNYLIETIEAVLSKNPEAAGLLTL